MKFLLGVMHPRRLKFFLDSLNQLDYLDVVLAKNMPNPEAENSVRQFFLDHDYDYLIFTSDDVQIPYEAPKKLMDDVEKHGYDIITGWSLCRPTRKEVNISLEPPKDIDKLIDRPILYHQYKFLTIDEVGKMLLNGERIIKVWFVGWSLTAMSRRVVEAWKPRGWFFNPSLEFQPHRVKGLGGFWASSDLWFSYQMWREGFDKYADLDVYVPHNPIGFSHRFRDLLVGKEKPMVEFKPAKRG